MNTQLYLVKNVVDGKHYVALTNTAPAATRLIAQALGREPPEFKSTLIAVDKLFKDRIPIYGVAGQGNVPAVQVLSDALQEFGQMRSTDHEEQDK